MAVKQKHSVVVAREEAGAARRADRQQNRKRLTRFVAGGIVSAGMVGTTVWQLLRPKRI